MAPSKKSNKPVVWFPFAAGGTVIAFFIPVIALLTLMIALGKIPPGLSYEVLHGWLANCMLAKLALFGILALSLWSSAHRLRCTCFDFGLRIDGLVAIVVYSAAIVASLAAGVYLLRI